MNLIEQLDDDRIATRNRYRVRKKYAEKIRPYLAAVANTLVEIDNKLINVTICADEIDLSYAGDDRLLKAIFKGLRKLGYAPDSRPQDNEPRFSTRFRHPDNPLVIYLAFTSSKCTRIKVGTKKIKVDVYETVCK